MKNHSETENEGNFRAVGQSIERAQKVPNDNCYLLSQVLIRKQKRRRSDILRLLQTIQVQGHICCTTYLVRSDHEQ